MKRECLTIPIHLIDIYNQLNYSSKKILTALLTGKKFTIVELTILTEVPSVTSAIRYIREAGIPVADYWVYTEYSRHKVYFIHNAGK